MIGSSIGLVFALSLVLPGALSRHRHGRAVRHDGCAGDGGHPARALRGPGAAAARPHDDGPVPFSKIAFDPQLLRLNFGIFTLHLAQMAMFVVIPLALVNAAGLPAGGSLESHCPP